MPKSGMPAVNPGVSSVTQDAPQLYKGGDAPADKVCHPQTINKRNRADDNAVLSPEKSLLRND
jgi:hypothetical protein